MVAFLLNFQKFFATNRKIFTNAFIIFETLFILAWLGVYFQAFTNYPSVVQYLFAYGATFGQLSLILYGITLLPGIITRLQILPAITRPIGSILMLYRRHFGILMFLTGFWHMTFTTTIPYFALYDFNPPGPPPLSQHQVMGSIAWWLLFPLWMTSNDFSQKKMGKWWKILHKLTYIAMFFIFLHVALQNSKWAIAMGSVVGIQVASWIAAALRKKNTPQPPAQVAASPQPTAEAPATSTTERSV